MSSWVLLPAPPDLLAFQPSQKERPARNCPLIAPHLADFWMVLSGERFRINEAVRFLEVGIAMDRGKPSAL
jgi:hypothetical protein